MKKCVRNVVCAMMFTAAGAGAAMADTVEMRYVGTGLHRSITLSGVVNTTVHAGELVHEFRNGTGAAASLNGLITTFCTEVTQHVSSNWKVFTLTEAENAPSPGSGMGEAKAAMLARLYGIAGGQQHESADFAAAFQMMVWEIVYDYDPAAAGTGNLSRTSGNLRFSSNGSYFGAVSTIFESLRTALLAETGVPTMNIAAVVNGTAQDQLLVLMPLPSAGAMALAGLMGVAGVRRRRA